MGGEGGGDVDVGETADILVREGRIPEIRKEFMCWVIQVNIVMVLIVFIDFMGCIGILVKNTLYLFV